MAEIHTIEEGGSERLRRRDRRSLSVSTKLTGAEANSLKEAALR
jgi:hypothetical protein